MKRWELLLGIMLALIRRLLENLGGYQKKEGALGRKFLVKVPFSFERLSLNKDLKVRYAVMPEGKKYWGASNDVACHLCFRCVLFCGIFGGAVPASLLFM